MKKKVSSKLQRKELSISPLLSLLIAFRTATLIPANLATVTVWILGDGPYSTTQGALKIFFVCFFNYFFSGIISQLSSIQPKIWNVFPFRLSGLLLNHEDKSQLCNIMSPHLSCSLQNPGSEGGLCVGVKQQKEVAWQHLLSMKSVTHPGNSRDWII